MWKLPYISATHTYMTETVTGWTNSISACPKPWVWNSILSLVWMCHSVIGRNLFAFSSRLQQLLTDFRLTGEGSIYSAALRQTHRRLDKDRLSACNFSFICAESEKKTKTHSKYFLIIFIDIIPENFRDIIFCLYCTEVLSGQALL